MARNTDWSSSNYNQNANTYTNVDPCSNEASPYYVHPNESPMVVVVSPPLTGDNYHTWARVMKCALISKNKYKFVDGTIQVPNAFDPSYEAWERCNSLIHSWILRLLSPSISHRGYIENVFDVLNDLKEIFSLGDFIQICELQQELYGLMQGTLNVSKYFTKLKTLSEELKNYRPIPRFVHA